MKNSNLKIIKKDDLHLGGFEGVVETRMVISPRIWQEAIYNNDISHGFGDFIYLANGYFKPHDGTSLHPHQNVDIVSIVLNGKVGHKGTLGNGTVINAPGVQVQRSGTGMQHSEFSMTDESARIIQVWFLPPKNGLKPDYQAFDLQKGKITTVLGGKNNFHSNMICKVGDLNAGESLSFTDEVIILLTDGEAQIGEKRVKKDDLIEGSSFELSTQNGCHVVMIENNR